jgi:hypothetical protein
MARTVNQHRDELDHQAIAPLGTIGQVAFVTRDLERSMDHFSRILGIGPWFFEPRLAFVEASYMGRPTAMEIAVGIANNGTMQYELIQQLDQHPSIYLEMLQRDPDQESFNHLCIWADDYEAKLGEARERGYVVAQTMISGLGAAAYLINPAIPQIALEVVEANAMRNRLRANVAAAAVDWDGSDPFRRGFPVNAL